MLASGGQRTENPPALAVGSVKGWDTEPADAIPFPEPTIAKDVVTFYPIGTVAAGYDEVAYEEYSNEPVEIPAHYLGGRPKAVTQ